MPLRFTLLAAALLGGALAPVAARAQSAAGAPAGAPLAGKYGCTQSHYRNGSYEYEMRGSIVLGAGTYTYVMGKPGRWRYDAATGKTHFNGGFLDGAEAAAIDGKRTRLFVTLPSAGRWTCSKVN